MLFCISFSSIVCGVVHPVVIVSIRMSSKLIIIDLYFFIVIFFEGVCLKMFVVIFGF